jgi:hypothetical protein
MTHAIVRIRKDEFRDFLENSKDVATQWMPDNIEFEQFTSHLPCEVDELMAAIDFYAGQEYDCVYIFNANLDDPDLEWNKQRYSDETIPEVKASEMEEYVVRSSMGKDFLYFACSLEEASCIKYTTLLPGGSSEEKDTEEEDDLA